MGRDLRRARAVSADLLQVLFDLLTARARCVEILLGIAFDLRLSVLAGLDFVTQTLKPNGKLGAIYARHVVLGLEETALLECTRLAIVAFGNIEDDSVSV